MSKRFPRLDTLLVVVSALNWMHIAWLLVVSWGVDCEFNCPWYHAFPLWVLVPTRLLAGALLLRLRRAWSEATSVVIAAQVVVGAYLYSLTPDMYRLEATGRGFFQASQWQAALAFALMTVGVWRLIGRVRSRTIRMASAALLGVVGVVAGLGWISNAASQPAAERQLARQVWVEVLRKRPFDAFSEESYRRFREAGTNVRPFKGYGSLEKPSAYIMGVRFVGPFLLEADYEYYNGRDDHRQGAVLFATFFGRVSLLRPEWGTAPLRWYLFPI
jgi:hypothetical protein